MTTVDDSLKPAISNWIWLAELPRATDALVVGEYPRHVQLGLEQHFETIKVLTTADVGSGRIPFRPQSFDAVVFGASLGEQLISGHAGSLDMLKAARTVVRRDGCVFLPVVRLRRRRPGALAKPLRRAGFGAIRSVYVYESFDRPDTMIPATRRAAAFFESWAWGGLRGMAGAAMAGAGAHHVSQPSLFFLAYP